MKKKLLSIVGSATLALGLLAVPAPLQAAEVSEPTDASFFEEVGAAISADTLAPVKTDEVYTLTDVNVSSTLEENTVSFTVKNDGFATVEDWSICYEAEYDIVGAEGIEVWSDSNVKTLGLTDTTLAPGEEVSFSVQVDDVAGYDAEEEYRVYGELDESAPYDESYVASLLSSADFVEYDCETGEEHLVTLDMDTVDEASSDAVEGYRGKGMGLGAGLVEDVEDEASTDAIIGKDNRTRVTSVKSNPYYHICFMHMKDSKGNGYLGTGFLISKNYVLTAAHCVYIDGKAASSINVYFGADGTSYGVKSSASVMGWCSSYPKDQSIANDWGYIKLNSDAGSTCGWFGIGYTDDKTMKNTSYTICGYPGDKASYNAKSPMDKQSVQMWKHSGKLSDVYSGYITYTMDTTGGQSGSPVYNSSNVAYGIHHGVAKQGKTNGAARITKSVYTFLKDKCL